MTIVLSDGEVLIREAVAAKDSKGYQTTKRPARELTYRLFIASYAIHFPAEFP